MLVETSRVLLQILQFDWLCRRLLFSDSKRLRARCHNWHLVGKMTNFCAMDS